MGVCGVGIGSRNCQMETLEIICGLHLQEKTAAHINMLAALTSHSALLTSFQCYDPFSTWVDTVSEYCYWFKLEIGQRKKIASGNISAFKSSLVLHGNILKYLLVQKVIKHFFLKVRDVVLYPNLNLRPRGLTMPGNLSNSWQASQQTKHMGWQGLKRWPLSIIGGRESCFHVRLSMTQWSLSRQTHSNLTFLQNPHSQQEITQFLLRMVNFIL